MQTELSIYEEYKNTWCVNQDVLLTIENFTYNMLQNWCKRKKLNRLRTKGRGRCGLIEFTSIPDPEREQIKKKHGDPFAQDSVQNLINRLREDETAAQTFIKAGCSPEKQNQYYTEAKILNAYGQLLKETAAKKLRNPQFKVTGAKEKIRAAINELKLVKYPNEKQKYPHNLPESRVGLDRVYAKYKENGPEILIHKGGGNTNKLKIKGAVADWLLATYCLPNKPNTHVLWRDYMKEAKKQAWPGLTEEAIYQWLQKPENRKQWFLARHGKAAFIQEFGHKTARDKSDWFPNCYLATDGTKLDWLHYKKGANYEMGADLKIDVVFDMYSEKIIGWYFGTETESHATHFQAFKMAVQEAQVKTPLITYDRQAGHKTSIMQELYDRLVADESGKHYPHRAYEHGSPVEQLFARFQQEVLNKMWFSDKQAITVRKEDSKPNMDFVKRFRHKLKRVHELKDVFAYCVKKWNKKAHPAFSDQSRNEVYNHEADYELQSIGQLEMMQLFWVTSKDPITYRRDGIKPKIVDEKYHFEVYDADGNVDLDFRDRYTGSKFYVQYDPNLLGDYVRLLLKTPNGQKRYVADAQPIKKIKSIPALMDDHDKNRMHKMTNVRDKEMERIEKKLEALRHRTGITEESMINDQELELKYQGKTPKKNRALAEAGPGSWGNKL